MQLEVEMSYPLRITDELETGKKNKIPVKLEIQEDCVIIFLTNDEDFFAEGKTIKEAKQNLKKSLDDELIFLNKHRSELSIDLTNKLEFLSKILK
jgi:hypothetical protein